MGKVWSKSELRVNTSAQTYSPGDQVTGQISLFLPTDCPQLTLVLSVRGTESFAITSPRETSSLDILGFSAPVYNSFLSAGQYMFPFGFILPPGIPSSFKAKTQAYDAAISYKVRVEAFNGQLKHETEFGVVNAVRDLKPVRVEQMFTVTTLCVFTSQLRVCGFLEKKEYWPGDRLSVSIAIDAGQSGRGVRQVTIDLLRVMKLRTKSGLRTYPQLIKGFVKEAAVGAHTTLPVIIEADFNLGEVNLGGNTTSGRIVESEFGINLTVRTYEELCSDGQEFSITLPVAIHGAAVPVDYSPPFPLEWRPAVMSQTHLSLPPQFAPSAPPLDL